MKFPLPLLPLVAMRSLLNIGKRFQLMAAPSKERGKTLAGKLISGAWNQLLIKNEHNLKQFISRSLEFN